MWTRFMDMHSGGGLKESPFQYIYIEAPQKEAEIIFYNRFGHNPHRVSCTCCGNDYSIDDGESLQDVTAFQRNCDYVYRRPDGTECPTDEAWQAGKGIAKGYTQGYEERQQQRYIKIRRECNTPDSDRWGLYQTLDEYLNNEDVLVIRADEIKDDERRGDVPEQGYVWID